MKALRLGFVSLFAAAVLLGPGGCGRHSNADFTPNANVGRTALEAALKSWKDGQPPGTVAGTSKPAVRVADSEWERGAKLAGFEIVGDEPPAGAGPRTFTVKLTAADGQSREVKYYVVGIDPLLIYRDIDYQKLSGM
jgi:hypothetical protein